MKPGVRAAGIAESYTGEQSTLCGVVVRADRAVDAFAFGSCTVGGTDGTDAVVDLLRSLLREDVQYVLLAGIAPAWFNVLDLHAIHDAVEPPVLSVSFEASEGLEPSLRREFEGAALRERLEAYRRQPERTEVTVAEGTIYVRGLGLADDEARDVVRAFTPEGERPEPVRIARLAARAADRWRPVS